MRRSAAFVAALVALFYFGQPVVPEATAIMLLHEFTGGPNDGQEPYAGLVQSGSTFFGATRHGGGPCPLYSVGCGTIFSINTDGSGFALLHEFAGGANDGEGPVGDLTLSGSTLFGTTIQGGDPCPGNSDGCGTIFSINTDGSSFTLLHEFAGGANDGRKPSAGLTLSGSRLFGTTETGGDRDRGTVFSINTDGSDFTLLHEFGGDNDDRWPYAGLTLSGSTLFGTTSSGGEHRYEGTIFSINTDGSGFALLHEFAGGTNDGGNPLAGLTLSGSTLFGTTLQRGDDDAGTIFSINTDGSGFTLLHEFAGGDNDGAWPYAALTLSGSTLFGTTNVGGDSNSGTVFSINTDGSNFTLLHEFAGGDNDGAVPHAGLTLSGSTLFGTTNGGGDNNRGTVFSIEIPGITGDYNNNGTVDAADYVVWRKNDGTQDGYDTWRANFGASAAGPSLPGDFNANGTVDAADYVVWRMGLGTIYTQDDYNDWQANFGATLGSGSSSAFPTPPSAFDNAVPEPSALLLMMLAGAGLLLSRSVRKMPRSMGTLICTQQHSSDYW